MQVGQVHELDADGVRVHAVEWKPNDPGREPDRHVLLVHGLGANTISWRPVGQPFADALGAHVTAIDLVGFGRTRAPERSASIATNRSVVEAVLTQRGPAVVVGNSMGAVIGAGVAARRPDLVDALLLVNPALPWGPVGIADWWRLARLAPLMMPSLARWGVSARARLLGPERVVDLTLAGTLSDPSRLDPELRRSLVQLAAERYAYPEAPAAYADAARSLLRELASGAFDRDLAAAAKHRPALLIHGEDDRLVCASLARAASDRCLELDVEMLDGVGHAPQLEAPERLVEVAVGWLDARMGPWPTEQAGPAMQAAGVSSGSPSGRSSPS